MCGIAGLTGPDAGPAVALMRDALAHRGPDGAGLYEDARLALGHRRLAVIDLSEAAAQPFASEDGALHLVWNGEIYDHVERREELRALGRPFRTASDTEVILRAYQEWGEGFLPRLNGMFALALYDRAAGRLLLARDRFGEKPLHLGWLEAREGPRRLAFASELRALLACPLTVRPRVSPLGVARYLAYDYVPSPGSILEGCERLGAGESLSLDLATGTIRRDRWWRPVFGWGRAGERAPSLEEAKARVATALAESVRLRLRADVPLGVFLSGGVDSSTVAALAARQLPAGRVLRTFAIGFEDASYDESSHARLVARHLGTQHSEETLSEARLLEALPGVLAHQDEPLADSSLLPTDLVSRIARRDVTVALGGDGGDELFCGYDTYQAWGPGRLVAGLAPRALQRAGGALAGALLPSSDQRLGLGFKLRRFLRGTQAPEPQRVQAWLSGFLPHEIGALLAPDLRAALGPEALRPEALYAPTIAAFEAGRAASDTDAQASVWLSTYLADGVLQKVDRASMAHALETRAPFLDPQVAAVAFGLPPSLRLGGRWPRLETKRVLKALARDLVPASVVDRPKQGFGVPLARWLRGPLRPLVEETLEPGRVRAGHLLDPAAVANLVAANARGRGDARALWALLVLETWRARFLSP